jgi:hypothetical protein
VYIPNKLNIIKKGFVVDVDEQLYMELQKIERA